MLFVWAFSSNINRSKSNWAKASLIYSIILPFIFLILFGFSTIISGLAFASYSGYNDKDYATEGIIFLEEVASASEMYEAIHRGQQTTLDQLEAGAFIYISDALKRKWKVEISGDMFIITSTDEMDGGSGKEIRYDRNTGKYSGYGR
tara:strand:- start:139 stop:579 length:441 start_codon:yes stop_codon:yes gene_type:complete